MTVEEAISRLQALGDERLRALNAKNGAGENQFGVKMGDIRALAKEIKSDHELGLQLWDTENVEARLLATLILKPKLLSQEKVDEMVRSVSYAWLAEWVSTNILKPHPAKEQLRLNWMSSENSGALRAGWGLTSERVAKDPEGLDLPGLLDRIEREMASAPEFEQWNMNMTLATIGIHHPELRDRAVAIGERLGVYRDYPCSKGCTSPFAPIWITEMVKRQDKSG